MVNINRIEFNVSQCYLVVIERQYTGASEAVSYTHLRAHETVLDLVCRLLLEKKHKQNTTQNPR